MGGLFTGPPKLPLRDPSFAPQDAASDGPDWRQPGRQSTVLAMLQPPDAETTAPLPPPSPPRASSPDESVPQRQPGRQSTILEMAKPLRILPQADMDVSKLAEEDGEADTSLKTRGDAKAGDQVVVLIKEADRDNVTFHAYPGKDAGGNEHEPLHFHLRREGRDGPRFLLKEKEGDKEDFKPMSDKDEKLYRDEKEYRRAISGLSDQQKRDLKEAARAVFDGKEIPTEVNARLKPNSGKGGRVRGGAPRIY